MNLDRFIEAPQRRREAEREGSPPHEEEENHGVPPTQPLFSVTALVGERGAGYITHSIGFAWEEFLELFNLLEPSLTQKGRGRRRQLEQIDRFFIFILCLTSGFQYRSVSAATNVAMTCIARIVEACLRDTVVILESLTPSNVSSVSFDWMPSRVRATRRTESLLDIVLGSVQEQHQEVGLRELSGRVEMIGAIARELPAAPSQSIPDSATRDASDGGRKYSGAPSSRQSGMGTTFASERSGARYPHDSDEQRRATTERGVRS
jgi:hypothetical protein